MLSQTYTYLALGDSYTIGEGVAIIESFPYQTIQLLRKFGHNFNAPEIIARTGWTTDDLKKGIRSTVFQTSYHFVSLMIGVNDEYLGRTLKEYETNFEKLLTQAIGFAADKAQHVFVFSIPDWGQTPFAASEDRKRITKEIQAFNSVNQRISKQYNVQYISILEDFTESFPAPDKLYPSGKEYIRWANELAERIQKLLI